MLLIKLHQDASVAGYALCSWPCTDKLRCPAENNEIDEPLLNLLQQNIDAARSANQTAPAEFMEKIRDAARKFVLTK